MKVKLWGEENISLASEYMYKNINNRDYEIEHIVIVPDRASLLTEKKLLDILPNQILFNVKVTTFSKFVLNLFSQMGVDNKLLTMAEQLLLIQKAVENTKKNFLFFKKFNITFCNQLSKTISLLQSSQVLPEDLSKEGNLKKINAKKFHDIALVYNEYLNLLGDRLDSAKLFEKLLLDIDLRDFVKNKKFYFAEFDSFTSQMYDVIKLLILNAKEINISFANPKGIGNKYIYEDDIQNKIINVCNDINCQVDVKIGAEKKSKAQDLILKNLYSCQVEKSYPLDVVKQINSVTKRQEVESVAKIIASKIREGEKFDSIAVAVSDINDYSALIEEIFSKYDFSYFIDKSINASQTVLVRCLFGLLNIKIHNYSKEALLNFFTNPLINSSSEIIEEVIKKQIDGKWKFFKFFSFENAETFYLKKLENISINKELFEMVSEFLNQLKIKHENYLNVLHERGLYKEVNIEGQSFDCLTQAIELIIQNSILDEKCDFKEFYKKLELILSSIELSSVPTLVDAIMIGDATESFFDKRKFLFVLGGENLPKTISDNSILTDKEIQSPISKKVVEPTTRMINRRNRFTLFNLLSNGWEEIYLSSLMFNEEGKPITLPSYIDQLSKLFEGKTVNFFKSLEKLTNENDVVNYFGCKKNLEAFLSIDKKQLQEKINLNSINIEQLFFNNGVVSASQLETYFSCPFKHFVRYGLKLKEKETFVFDQRDIGNLCHRAVELFVKKYLNKDFNFQYGIIDDFIERNFDIMLKDEHLEEKLSLICEREGVEKFLKLQLKTILTRVCKELSLSFYKPKQLELKVEGNLFKELKFVGKIDRIDFSDNFFRIIDYKTGKPKSLLKELYYGEKLQLFLYSSIIQNQSQKICGGVFYFDCKFDFQDSDGGKYILKGLAENDDANLKLFDKNLEISEKSQILQLSLSKSGKQKYTGSAISKKPLSFYMKYAITVANKAIEEIKQGFIKPSPDNNSCEHCIFSAICCYNKNEGVRNKPFKESMFKEGRQ